MSGEEILTIVNPAKAVALNFKSRLPILKINFQKNQNFDALVDSGSTISLISRECFQNIKNFSCLKNVNKVNTILENAGQSRSISRIKANIHFKIDSWSWNFEFHVMNHLPYAVILGNDFIKKSQMIINSNEGLIYFNFHPIEHIQFINDIYDDKRDNELYIGTVQRERFREMITEFSDVITTKIGKAHMDGYEIKIKPGSKPVRSRPYQCNPQRLEAMRDIVNKLLDEGIVTPSKSEFSSAAFLVNKKEPGKYRLVCAYQAVNQLIEFDQYPMPVIDNLFQHLKNARIFTSMDLNNAYFQIPLAENSRKYTAFTTPFGLFEFTTIPQGIRIGSQALARYVEEVLADLKFKTVIAFADDVLIYSPDPETHERDLREVLIRLRNSGLTVNPDKISLAKEAVHFLGHIVKDGKLFIDPDRTDTVRNFPVPNTLKKVQRFVGMCSFYAKFIEGFANICRPLNILKRKGAKFKWGPDQQASFDELKTILTSPPVLHLPDYHKEFILTCDASEHNIACVLQQRVDGGLVPISYASRTLSGSEKGYNMFKKEFLACLWGCEKFKSILMDYPFILQTDCQAITYVLNSNKQVGQLARWRLRLSEFRFKVEHVRGKLNVVADCLSRMFEENDNVEVKEVSTERCCFLQNFPECFQSIAERQRADGDLGDIIKRIEAGELVKNYRILKGVLRYQKNPKSTPKIVVPKDMQHMITHYFHSPSYQGHLGVKKTVAKIMKEFTWDGMFSGVKAYVRSCELCQMSKPAQNTKIGLMSSSPPTAIFERLHIDFFGPLTRSRRGNMYVLVAIDSFSKFSFIIPLRSATSETAIRALEEHVFAQNGIPQIIVSDHGSQFNSHKFRAFTFGLGIKHIMTSVARPNSNMSERLNRNLKYALKIFHSSNQNMWDEELTYLQIAFNSAKHEVTNESPAFVFLGRELKHPLQLFWNIDADLEKHQPDAEERLRKVIVNLRKAHERTKRRYDTNRLPSSLKEGDKVLYRKFVLSNKAKKVTNKLSQGWCGPFTITQVLNDVNVKIVEDGDPGHERIVHVAQLKKFVVPPSAVNGQFDHH